MPPPSDNWTRHIGELFRGGPRCAANNPAGEEHVNLDTWKREAEKMLAIQYKDGKSFADWGRRGFPESLRGWAWMQILGVHNVKPYHCDLSLGMREVFGDRPPVQFQPPLFNGSIDLDAFSLASENRHLFKCILCVLSHRHPTLEYAPVVPLLVAIFLQSMDADKTLGCIEYMLRGKPDESITWNYFPLHRRDFLIFVRVFEDLVRKFLPNVAKHVGELQLLEKDYAPQWDKLLAGLFVGIWPMKTVARIVDCYVCEGFKIILRFALARVSMCQQECIRAISGSEIDRIILAHDNSVDQKTLFKIAFNFRFSRTMILRYRNRHRKLSIGDFDSEDRIIMFHRPLPRRIRPSSFATEADWEAMWSWIPNRYKLLNLDLAFTTAEHGHRLSTMYELCEANEPIILLIETAQGSVFGAYLSKSFASKAANRFYGTGETFLFKLRPQPESFTWKVSDTGYQNTMFIYATALQFACGASDGKFGLCLDEFMTKVTSDACDTFRNVPLTANEKDHRVHCVEAFVFM